MCRNRSRARSRPNCWRSNSESISRVKGPVMATTNEQTKGNGNAKERTIYSCNFRSAGRLSNENARSLTSIHETFARHLATALDAYLGSGLEVKLSGLDQYP